MNMFVTTNCLYINKNIYTLTVNLTVCLSVNIFIFVYVCFLNASEYIACKRTWKVIINDYIQTVRNFINLKLDCKNQ